MVLSPRSLPYASLALSSLTRNADEPFSLQIITDSAADKRKLLEQLEEIPVCRESHPRKFLVFSSADLADREALRFSRYGNLQSFRRGHPCWRKLTDPILLSEDEQEMVILDPDLYFPNKFRFDPTPQTGLLLMWQRPSCLLPHEVVKIAMEAGISLAHHTDIGVAQWRMPVDLEWLDWLIGKLGSPNLPLSMHVESIVWAALAMKIGGGHLDSQVWLCWRRSQYKRLLRKLGVSGPQVLRLEPFSRIKCFHAGGEAKWWLPEAAHLGFLERGRDQLSQRRPSPFAELTPKSYMRLQRNRRWLKRLGYYSFFPQ